MKEVAGRIVAVYVALARAQGLDVGALLADLPLDPTELRDRFDFDAVMTLLDRTMHALGGPTALEDAFVRFEPTSPEMVALGSRFATPMEWATFVHTKLEAAHFSCVELSMRELSSNRYELRSIVASGYRVPPAFLHATVGLVRGLPRVLGLAQARVTWSGLPHDFVCRVTLLPRVVPTLDGDALAIEARARAGTYLAALLADRAHYRRDAERVGRTLQRIGQASEEDSTSIAYAGAVVRAFHEELAHTYCVFWEARPDSRAPLAAVGLRGPESLLLPLFVKGERVGEIETDPVDGRDTLQPLLPLIALGLQGRLLRERSVARAAETPLFPLEWSLTKRQRDVAALVLQGRSNPVIAATLGCAIGTVEDHLTAIYEKTGVAGRQVLMARVAGFRRG